MLGRVDLSGTRYFYAADKLGTVLSAYRDDGAAVALVKAVAYDRTAVTKRVAEAGGAAWHDRIEYAGLEYDPTTRMVSDTSRWFDPTSGRYTGQGGVGFGNNPYPVAGNNAPNEAPKPKSDPVLGEPTGHDTAGTVAGWLWDNGRYTPWGVGIWAWEGVGNLAGVSKDERRETAVEVGAGVWDRGWGMTGGMVETFAPRDTQTGEINWGLSALQSNPLTASYVTTMYATDDRYTNRFLRAVQVNYDGYRAHGFNKFRSGLQTFFSTAPITSSGVRLAEMWSGRSYQGSNYGTPLSRADRYFLKPLDTGLDLLPWVSVLKAGRAGRTANAGKSVPSKTPTPAAPIGAAPAPAATGWVARNLPTVNKAADWLVHGQLSKVSTKAHDWVARQANRLGFEVCFAAGTLMDTESGWRKIEDVRPGEQLWSQDEYDPEGRVLLKVVEAAFVREGLLWRLRMDGREVLTTAEHPFYAWEHGWTPCNQLTVGDRLRTRSGQWVTVEAVEDTGEWTTVYNLRIADFHTYFVRGDAWSFSLWAHNANCSGAAKLTKQQRLAEARKWADAANQRAIHPDRPEPASFSALTKKQKELVRKSARENGMLGDDAVVLHGNSPTKAPGVQYELRRLDADHARQAAGFKDWDAGSVAKIGETTYFRDVGGRVVQERYSAGRLRSLQFVVTKRGPQTAMREAEAASIAAYVDRFGHPPELNIAAAAGKGNR